MRLLKTILKTLESRNEGLPAISVVLENINVALDPTGRLGALKMRG